MAAPTEVSPSAAAAAAADQLLPLAARRLEGKVAVITGGAAGIGESIVRKFHINGCKLVILDIQEDLGRLVCSSLGGAPIFLHGDVTNEADVSRAVDLAVETFGHLDIMVNNAGIAGSRSSDIRQVSFEDFRRVLDVNLCGPFLGTKHAARVMIPRGKGSIVAIGSVCSVVGGIGPHAYTVSKHGLVGMTRGAAAELGLHGIRVNCVSPYAVAASLSAPHLRTVSPVRNAPSSNAENIANLKGLMLTADDVADAVLYLAGDDSRYVSGHNLLVDGGFSVVNHAFGVYR